MKFNVAEIVLSTNDCYAIYRNVGTYYSWKCPQGFNILPKNGSLAPKEKCRLSATFCPDSAKVYADFAECNYSIKDNIEAEDFGDSMYTKVMKMEGVGKFPYVTAYNISEQLQLAVTDTESNMKPVRMLVVQFGHVAVGDSVEKWITVENPSSVSCMCRTYSSLLIQKRLCTHRGHIRILASDQSLKFIHRHSNVS